MEISHILPLNSAAEIHNPPVFEHLWEVLKGIYTELTITLIKQLYTFTMKASILLTLCGLAATSAFPRLKAGPLDDDAIEAIKKKWEAAGEPACDEVNPKISQKICSKEEFAETPFCQGCSA